MPDLSRFRALGPPEKVLVAVAVLLDGRDAAEFLKNDKERGMALSRAAEDLSELEPDLRMPLLGSLLRSNLGAMHGQSTSKGP